MTVLGPVTAFLLAGLVAVVALTGIGAVVTRRVADRQAIDQARFLTHVMASDVAGPALTSAALAGDGPERASLDQVVRAHVLDSRIVNVKIWDSTGMVLYSDDVSLIGRRFQLGADEQQALAGGSTVAELSDLRAPENAGQRAFGSLLEVYEGTRTVDGQRVLFETYQRYAAIAAASRQTRRSFAPALLGVLALLWLVQAPLALRLARRMRASQREQQRLLGVSVAAGEAERRRIAADLHDGVVQTLAGAGWSLSAVAARSGAADRETLLDTAGRLRQAVRELRTLLVTIAPPRLHSQGLGPALTDVASALTARGVAVTLAVDEAVGAPGTLGREQEALLFRVAQEAVRNILRHADAQAVSIAVQPVGTSRVELTVTDDGTGFLPAAARALDSDECAHLGLGLLADLVSHSGGELSVTSTPGAGTRLHLQLPRDATTPPATGRRGAYDTVLSGAGR